MEMFLGIVTGVLETTGVETRIIKEQQERNLDQITMMEGPPLLNLMAALVATLSLHC